MKKIVALTAALLLAAGLLAGCGGTQNEQPNRDEALQAELEAMREANTLENVFATHVQVTCTTETWNIEDGAEVWLNVNKDTYNSAGVGTTFYSETQDADGLVASSASYADDVTPFALYSVLPVADLNTIGIYPTGEYESIVNAQWLTPDAEVEEIVISVENDEETGTKMITTQKDYESGGFYVVTIYFIDAETGLINGIEQTSYDFETHETLDVSRSNINYNQDFERTVDPVATIAQADDACALTFVLNPGADNEETLAFTVAKGTLASVISTSSYEMYADEACTEYYDEVIADQDEMTVYVKFVS